MHPVRRDSLFMPVMAALIATSWLALWLWGQSPYGRYLEHTRWTDFGVAGAICAALVRQDLEAGRDARAAAETLLRQAGAL